MAETSSGREDFVLTLHFDLDVGFATFVDDLVGHKLHITLDFSIIEAKYNINIPSCGEGGWGGEEGEMMGWKGGVEWVVIAYFLPMRRLTSKMVFSRVDCGLILGSLPNKSLILCEGDP